MRIPRFFARETELEGLQRLYAEGSHTGSPFEITDSDIVKQMRSVLRLGSGQRIVLLDGLGRSFELHIDRVERARAICVVDAVQELASESNVSTTMAVSLIKADRFEWCLEKLTELGVSKIVPIISERTLSKWKEPDCSREKSKWSSRISRWNSIARESSEQSERSRLPLIDFPQDLSNFLKRPARGGNQDLKFICAERKQAASLLKNIAPQILNANTSAIQSIDSITIIVGPEGGFTESEFACARSNGWQEVSLGRRILRSETAAISAMSQVASILDI